MTAKKKPWRRILYEKQDYPDNYVDPIFWQEMKREVQIRRVGVGETFRGASAVTFQLCSVCTFASMFVYLDSELIDPFYLLTGTCASTAFGYVCYRLLQDEYSSRSVLEDMKSAFVFLLFGFWVSPILMTLTDTISTDTVYAMTVFMFFIHLVFHSYGEDAAIVSWPLSLNAALFGCICLASRLPDRSYAFSLLVVAVSGFALLPALWRKMREHCDWRFNAMVVVVHCALSLGSVLSLSLELAACFAALLFVINVVCPIWFLRWQKDKDNIYGLWDEAEIPEAEHVVK